MTMASNFHGSEHVIGSAVASCGKIDEISTQVIGATALVFSLDAHDNPWPHLSAPDGLIFRLQVFA